MCESIEDDISVDDEDPELLNFSYIEPNYNKSGAPADNVESCLAIEWTRMRPPKKSNFEYSPFITARQIDLVRTILLGTNALKWDNKQLFQEIRPKKLPTANELPIKLKKSSLKFIENEMLKEY